MTGRERDPVVPPTHFVPEGDKPKVEATRRYFAAIFAGCRTAEECARELQRDHDALAARVQENNDALDRAYQARDDWKGQAQILAARVQELEAALRALIRWSEGAQGDEFGTTEWTCARATLKSVQSDADTPPHVESAESPK